MADNTLYYGDNLDIMRRYIKDESIDLVYLDPPFNSNQTYNVLYAEQGGSRSAAQIKAFDDTWHWGDDAAEAYQDVVEVNDKTSEAMRAFWQLLGASDMMAYLAMMAPRLKELHRVLKPTGCLYLHCDPTASHYLKLLLDSTFGPGNFRNEIIWHYKFRMMDSARIFNRKHDVLLFYAKSAANVLRMGAVVEPWTREDIIRTRKQAIYTGDDGREWVWMPGGRGHSKNKKKYLEQIMAEGKALDDVWDIPIISSSAKERLGYPTQKPELLLERIIKASSGEGDTVLDPFCGCGTTISVAQRLNRRWIGIDITPLAISLIKHRLQTAHEGRASYTVIGEPVSLPDAEYLAKSNPNHFELWALGLVGARQDSKKKGADQGVDGRLIFHDDTRGMATKQIIFSVKAGHVTVSQVRDLRGVIEREKAQIGVLISFEQPTQPMRAEAASAGFYDSPSYGRFPRLQLLTVEQLLAGERVKSPPLGQTNRTHRNAPRAKGDDDKATTLALPWDDDTESG